VKKLKLDSHLRQKMGEMGRALIDQEFSWEVESKILFERYRNVLN
jgi:hypothetical protein